MRKLFTGEGSARLGRWMEKARSGLVFFLEAIGLRDVKDVDHAAMLSRFKLYHTEFRKLLSANNSFLETLTDLDHLTHSRHRMDRNSLKHKVVRAMADVHSMMESLNSLSDQRYPGLRDAFDRISAQLNVTMEESTRAEPKELVLDLSEIRSHHAELVGGKMAHIAELRNVLGLPTPDGFVITTQAFRLLMEEGGLRSWIQNMHLDLSQSNKDGNIQEISEALQSSILDVTVPERLREDMEKALTRLSSRVGPNQRLAVRSSALGEDSDLSFAGQYLTVLNIPSEYLFQAYLQVVASLYSPEAMQYRLLHNLPGDTAEMAVGVLNLVDSLASGVVFSRDPNRPDSSQLLVQAVWGLGVSLVEGRTSPEAIAVSRGEEPIVLDRTLAQQTCRIVPIERGEGGRFLQEETLAKTEFTTPCLRDEEALELARWTLKIEGHFGMPQDIEWALDRGRTLILLQARPLTLLARTEGVGQALEGYPLLLRGGDIACPGVGAGPAVHMSEDDDLDSFPEGGVLVARRPSPKFIRIMARTRAIVTDAGSTTGHMASLARELRVPTLLNTKSATRSIPAGGVITVDAIGGFVYEGDVPVSGPEESRVMEASEGLRPGSAGILTPLVEKIVSLVAPLNLTDPRSREFIPDGCLTLHDLARFIHEKSYEEMFGLGEKLGDVRASSYLLDVFLPIDLYIIDLGGGFVEIPKNQKVKRSQIASVPLAALLKGMLHKDIPRFGARPMDLGGFFSIMMRHAVNTPEQERTFQDPCYALISDRYLNLTARVGYHFSVVDSYCGATANKNYISLLFRGGAADNIRRGRRVRAIAGILKEHGFAVEVRGDAVSARLSKAPQEETAGHLEMIGRLLQFFRQMDVSMTTEESVRRIQEAFLRGDYKGYFSQSTRRNRGTKNFEL